MNKMLFVYLTAFLGSIKLLGYITWPWWIVFSPLLVPVLIIAISLFLISFFPERDGLFAQLISN